MELEQYISRELKVDTKSLEEIKLLDQMTELKDRDEIISNLINQVIELKNKNERHRVALKRYLESLIKPENTEQKTKEELLKEIEKF